MTEEQICLIRTAASKVCMCCRINTNESEELVQEVMCRAIRNHDAIHDLKAWVASCAMNLIRHRYRDWKLFLRKAPILYNPEVPEDKRLAESELSAVVEATLESLTPKQRQAVERWLKKASGEKVENSLGKERALVFRAFRVLRKRFPQAVCFVS